MEMASPYSNDDFNLRPRKKKSVSDLLFSFKVGR